MERLITVKDIRERFGCSAPTARRYLRQMFHYEHPLTAPVWAFNEWEKSRERSPVGRVRITQKTERIFVPRRR